MNAKTLTLPACARVRLNNGRRDYDVVVDLGSSTSIVTRSLINTVANVNIQAASRSMVHGVGGSQPTTATVFLKLLFSTGQSFTVAFHVLEIGPPLIITGTDCWGALRALIDLSDNKLRVPGAIPIPIRWEAALTEAPFRLQHTPFINDMPDDVQTQPSPATSVLTQPPTTTPADRSETVLNINSVAPFIPDVINVTNAPSPPLGLTHHPDAALFPLVSHGPRPLRALLPFVVKPFHCAQIPVGFCDGSPPPDQQFVMEPCTDIGAPEFAVGAARTICHKSDEGPFIFMAEISNLSAAKYNIQPGDVVGHAHPFPHSPTPATALTAVVSPGHTSPKADDDDLFDSALRDMDIDPSLTADQRTIVMDMLRVRKAAFSYGTHDIGHSTVAEFHVDTGTAAPISSPPYHASPKDRQAIEDATLAMLDANLAKPSTSPWASPVIMIKQNDKLRMVIDYRKVNAVTKGDQYPIPRIDDILAVFEGSKFMSTMDANRGYHQVPVDEESQAKLAFRNHLGLFQPTVMPFGAKGAPACFQRMMDLVLGAAKWAYAIVYIDDIIVYSRSFDDHLQHLATVLDNIINAGLTISVSKSHLFKHSFEALGHTISEDGIGMLRRNVDAVLKQPIPTTLKALERFVGLAAYYRHFIHNFALIALPLFSIIKAKPPGRLKLSDELVACVTYLKQLLSEAPILRHPDYNSPWLLYVDASLRGFGAVLSQRDEKGKEYVVRFLSRAIKGPELNYSATELEAAAIAWAVHHCRCYIEGKKLTIITDHAALQWLLEYHGTNTRLMRQSLELQPYRPHVTISHRSGKKHVNADQLSREPITGLFDDMPQVDVYASWTVGLDGSFFARVAKGLPKDDVFGDIFHALDPNGAPDDVDENVITPPPHILRRYKRVHDLLYKLSPKGALMLCIPDTDKLREHVLWDFHDAPISAHRSATKTHVAVGRQYYWPNMRTDVEEYVRSCHACQVNKPTNLGPVGRMQPLPIPPDRWRVIAIDWATNLPLSDGYDAIMVISDKFTGRKHLIPTKTTDTALDTAHILVRELIRHHGVPEVLISDRDPKFTSDVWQQISKVCGIKAAMATTKHAQTDGVSERAVRTLKEAMRSFVNVKQTNWAKMLPMLEIAFNSSIHASTKRTPYELDLGYHPRNFHGVVAAHPDIHLDEDAATFIQHLDSAYLDAVDALEAAQDVQIKYKDKGRSEPTFRAGDQVLVSSKLLKPSVFHARPSKKLAPRWFGPFNVITVPADNVVTLDLPDNVRSHPTINVQHIRRYTGRLESLAPAAVRSVRTIEAIIDFKIGRRTNAYPDGQPMYLTKFENQPEHAIKWLDEATVKYYGGEPLITERLQDDNDNV